MAPILWITMIKTMTIWSFFLIKVFSFRQVLNKKELRMEHNNDELKKGI